MAVAGDGRRLTGGGWAWRSAAFARHQPHPRGAPAPAEAANSASGFARVKSERKFFTRTPVVLGLKKGKINYVHFFLLFIFFSFFDNFARTQSSGNADIAMHGHCPVFRPLPPRRSSLCACNAGADGQLSAEAAGAVRMAWSTHMRDRSARAKATSSACHRRLLTVQQPHATTNTRCVQIGSALY